MPSGRRSILARRLGVDGQPRRVVNRERISIDSSLNLAAPMPTATSTDLPVRVTLEHTSEVTQTENLSLHLSLLGQGGLEKQISGGHVDVVPAFGIEFRLGVTVSY